MHTIIANSRFEKSIFFFQQTLHWMTQNVHRMHRSEKVTICFVIFAKQIFWNAPGLQNHTKTSNIIYHHYISFVWFFNRIVKLPFSDSQSTSLESNTMDPQLLSKKTLLNFIPVISLDKVSSSFSVCPS